MSASFDQEMLQDFVVEVLEHIEQIEMSCLALEGEEGSQDGINCLFRAFHTIKGLAGFVEQHLIQRIAHHTEDMLEKYRKTLMPLDSTMISLVLDSADLVAALCKNLSQAEDDTLLGKADELLLRIEAHQRRDTTLSVEGSLTSESPTPDEPAAGEQQRETFEDFEAPRKQKRQKAIATGEDVSYIRVPAQKVDSLVDMLGELMILEAGVEQSAGDTLVLNLAKMSRITKEMQNLAISMRMVSLKSTLQKLQRVARDTSSQLGKPIDIELRGEETEIDRGVAEKLLEPLLHLVRNSISHGLESAEERASLGKSPQGHLLIAATSNRGHVSIEVSDDGRGIDSERVLSKAREKGLVDPSATYADDEVINLVFLPGFSTAEAIDETSGRGVGLDVVKVEVARLGGKISVGTEPGRGTRFTLKIPINLAILNGTIVTINEERYIIPTLYINKILHCTEEHWVRVHGRQAMIRMRDTLVPLVEDRALNHRASAHEEIMVVVLEYEQKLRALRVQGISDRRDIVVKPLGEEFQSVQCFSGASILGDGRVSLILDIEALFRKEVETW